MKLLVTGGHTGIGLELTKLLLAQGHRVGLVVRDQQRANGLSEQLDHNNIDFFFADLSVQSQVITLADSVKQQWETVDGLFNNAGVLLDDTYYSAQDNEMHYEVNVLAPFQLVRALSESLAGGFVVNTVTGGLHNQTSIKLEHLIKPQKFVKLMGAYYQSKLAMLLLMNDFDLNHPNIRVLNVDPGALKTKMTGDKKAMPFFMKPIVKLMFKPPIHGAKKLFNAAFLDKFSGQSGVYITGNAVKKLKLDLSSNTKEKLLTGIVS